MERLPYLAYGSNLLSARLAARVGAVEVIARATLPGYTLRFNKRGRDGSGKCTLVAQAGATAYGVVYALPIAARGELDRIEGLGRGYEATHVKVPTVGECYVYLAQDGWTDDALAPYDWYRDLVVAGAREHGLPAAYVAAIAAVAARPDPDAARAADHRALIAGPR
ncbi:MAG: gamma-glutamylcyclotransferase [Gammaproteobacteria bacterium]|nr:gamma-glutamylcyclotransferase [Gammaproteobacteria bacterium]